MVDYIHQVPARSEVSKPVILRGQSNGEIDPTLRRPIPSERPANRPGFEMVVPAARAYVAMHAAARADGVVLKPTSAADTYRSVDNQLALFKGRYAVDGQCGKCKTCPGFERRCKKCNANGQPVATAACPGASNHGWGLAVDLDLRDGPHILAWLEANARAYGFGWETVPEEPWHIRYFVGDAVPAAVLAFEGGTADTTSHPIDPAVDHIIDTDSQPEGDDDMPTHRWTPKGFRNEFEIPGGLPITPAELLNPDQSGAFLNDINPFGDLKQIIEFHTHRLTAIIHRNGITPQQIADGYFIRDETVELSPAEIEQYRHIGIPI